MSDVMKIHQGDGRFDHMTDEEFLEHARQKSIEGAHRGVREGWWESVNERGEPVPFPIKVLASSLPANATMAHALAKANIFTSISEARKNGWNKPLEFGLLEFKRKKMRVQIIDDMNMDT